MKSLLNFSLVYVKINLEINRSIELETLLFKNTLVKFFKFAKFVAVF